ncbi:MULTISPECIES: PPC domain-containing DNA-binding protein [unclassified Streptomyces]|uniref:PPC domain-containing DNA-binding protein n=1 Tax=unclassified Streptomyces TaxID=2593676 RepID=UPI0008DD17D8|nr:MULTISPECIES: PPC domain-containing DNA-binding protein [unclassified Streptomyces]OII67818.1 DNA-binding protein with PD1-like DNA-binding motif [Streptomyces sp. CC77]
MRWQQLEEDRPGGAYLLVLDPGEDPVACLNGFAAEREVRAAQITAVGAFETAVVGWYDRDARDYRRIPVGEQCEVLSLVGDVAEGEDGPAAHVHTVLGLADGSTRGGHLLEARVWPTLEVVLRTSPATLRKTYRPEVGLALIAPSGGGRPGPTGQRVADGGGPDA